MAKITISMPDRMSEYVSARIESGQYGNVSEYFRDLVRRDRERREAAIAELRDMLDKAEASGVSEKSMDDIMREAEEDLRSRGPLPPDG